MKPYLEIRSLQIQLAKRGSLFQQWCPYEKEKCGHRWVHRESNVLGEKGRDLSEGAKSKECQRPQANPQDQGERPGTDCLSKLSEGTSCPDCQSPCRLCKPAGLRCIVKEPWQTLTSSPGTFVEHQAWQVKQEQQNSLPFGDSGSQKYQGLHRNTNIQIISNAVSSTFWLKSSCYVIIRNKAYLFVTYMCVCCDFQSQNPGILSDRHWKDWVFPWHHRCFYFNAIYRVFVVQMLSHV